MRNRSIHAKYPAEAERGIEQAIACLREAVEPVSALASPADPDAPEIAGLIRSAFSAIQDLESFAAKLDEADNAPEFMLRIAAMRNNLAEAERLAVRDPLTGVINRREGERRLVERLEQRIPFCAFLVHPQRLTLHSDQIRKLVARRLSAVVRDTDIVCRWAEDEFLVVMECALHDAGERAQLLQRQIAGRYTVLVEDRSFDVRVTAAVSLYTGNLVSWPADRVPCHAPANSEAAV